MIYQKDLICPFVFLNILNRVLIDKVLLALLFLIEEFLLFIFIIAFINSSFIIVKIVGVFGFLLMIFGDYQKCKFKIFIVKEIISAYFIACTFFFLDYLKNFLLSF